MTNKTEFPEAPSFLRLNRFGWSSAESLVSPFEALSPLKKLAFDALDTDDRSRLSQQSSRVSLSFSQSLLQQPSTRKSNIRLELQPTTSATKTFDLAMAKLPPEHIAGMFIDHGRYNGDPLAFDTGKGAEPGYARAMLTAFAYLRETVDKPVDAQEILALHTLATQGVKTNKHEGSLFGKKKLERVISGDFAVHGGMQQYGLYVHKVTPNAWQELYEERLVCITPQALNILESMHEDEFHMPASVREAIAKAPVFQGDAFLSEVRVRLGCSDLHIGPYEGCLNFEKFGNRAPRRIEEYCERYRAELVAAASPHDKLRALVRLCRALEIGHFFTDGNQRTTAFLLVNKLLMQNDMSPTILPDPTVLDGYKSVEELVEEVRAGQTIFAHLCETPEYV